MEAAMGREKYLEKAKEWKGKTEIQVERKREREGELKKKRNPI